MLRTQTQQPALKRLRKRVRNHPTQPKNICIFCAKAEDQLHDCTTLHAHENVQCMATELQDTALLARIAGVDLIAIEAKYNLSCLSELRNQHCSLSRQQRQQSCEAESERQKTKAKAFIELTTPTENSVEDGTYYCTFILLSCDRFMSIECKNLE